MFGIEQELTLLPKEYFRVFQEREKSNVRKEKRKQK
jgi:hypothetical protein